MLQMVDEVHLQHNLLSSNEVWWNIQRQGKIFGHSQLCVRESVNQLKSNRALLIVGGSVNNVLPPLTLLLTCILLHIRRGCISLKEKLCFMYIL